MSQLQQSINDQPYNGGPREYGPPKVVLLTEQQWSYIRKRFRMTNREFQIAKLICRGLNNEEIAKIVNIKNGTVKTHIRNIYRKTWVHNKIAMLLRFVEDANHS